MALDFILDFGFYAEVNEEAINVFKQKNDMIRFEFQTDQPGHTVDNELEEVKSCGRGSNQEAYFRYEI